MRAAISDVKAALLKAYTQIGLAIINAPASLLGQHQRHRSLKYGEDDTQTLDLYLPRQPGANKTDAAMIVFVYGGSWDSGKKEDYVFAAEAFTNNGYAVAIPDYAKYPAVQFPRFVEDIASAIAWLTSSAQQHHAVNEIVLVGHSAGAHTAALLSADPRYLGRHGLEQDLITHFIGLAGPYTWTPDSDHYRNVFANLEDFSDMRPDSFLTGEEPPMLLLHGADDTTVMPKHTRNFAAAVLACGGKASHSLLTNNGHVKVLLSLSRLLRWRSQTLATIIEFLNPRS